MLDKYLQNVLMFVDLSDNQKQYPISLNPNVNPNLKVLHFLAVHSFSRRISTAKFNSEFKSKYELLINIDRSFEFKRRFSLHNVITVFDKSLAGPPTIPINSRLYAK
ncbi:hypothetical protein DERP_003050 [Dermatophagoides pteronyssinus]|uniref:Uncharacterized protein n=1 Tax=Dermatophagoides pteronyssinus TaxID=6956 RepID=A0ABQ8JIE3_DERPT|nr:hypothetical protein DERP_003050 [Dermatophagoides pteronyssinus]